MLDETIAHIESIVDEANLAPKVRSDLRSLVASLRSEIVALHNSNPEQARSIAGHAQISAFEATRAQRDEPLVQHTLDGLTRSVEQFEVSHPSLVGAVNGIHQLLANIGLS